MVLEWSRAETGVGPSMAEGSHGCMVNCADFPVAAANSPIIGIVLVLYKVKTSWKFIDVVVINQAAVVIRPMSPIRL